MLSASSMAIAHSAFLQFRWKTRDDYPEKDLQLAEDRAMLSMTLSTTLRASFARACADRRVAPRAPWHEQC
ncbi:protein of unknown function (plasmid) [Caballeronia sp. S22]